MNQTRWRLIGFSLLLFAVNAFLCRELFSIEYLRRMTSIESVFISLARYIRDNWNDLTWFPLWMGGMPFQNTYAPGVPTASAALSSVLNTSAAHAYHILVAFTFCAGPVTLFWLAYYLSRSMVCSFSVGLAHAVFSPAAFLISDVASDLGGFFRPRRLQTLIVYGEGPHISGMMLLPLAVLLVHRALSNRRPHDYVLAALACVITVLTNWLSGVALALAVIGCAVIQLDGLRSFQRVAISLVGIAALAYCFTAPAQPPSTIRTVQFNSRTIEGDYRNTVALLPLRAIIIAAVLVALVYILRRVRASRELTFFAVFTLLTASLALPAAWFGVAILPQPNRYQLEMEMAIAGLLVFGAHRLLSRIPKPAALVAAAAFLTASVVVLFPNRNYAQALLQSIDMSQTVEYKTAQWFDQHMPGQRVMAPGATSFWMNAFTDTPQLGGVEQGPPNYQARVAVFTEYWSGGLPNEGEISDLWLRAFGVQAVAVGGPQSREAFKPFRNPAKFQGRYPELWREGDDVIYRVPQRSMSLAHVVNLTDLPARAPGNGLDVEAFRDYVVALENPLFPEAPLKWTSRHSAEAVTNLTPGQVISVQIAYHPGWRATTNGSPATVRTDALGQIAIEPICNGPCQIKLEYDGGREMKIARWLAHLAAIGSFIWIVQYWWFRRVR